MLAKALQSASNTGVQYVDDVFSTYLYTGNGSTQTITNGIDLSGQGGMVWTKARSAGTAGYDNFIYDTVRGVNSGLATNKTAAADTTANVFTSFSNTGYGVGVGISKGPNESGTLFASWTFRKAPKFFDVVTYTGTGVNRTIAHSLGQVPGMIIVKRTDTTGDWQVYHRSLANTEYMVLNSTAAKATDTTRWNSTTPTATEFTVGTDATVNANGGTYVAYLFAHDTAADGLIQCGSFTTDVSSNATVNLGWEPQFVLVKQSSTTGNWVMFDQMRGMLASTQGPTLFPNTTGAEGTAGGTLYPAATGFAYNQAASTTYVYVAIRRSNKPPTSGTQVFSPTVYTGTNADNRLVNTGLLTDLVLARQRSGSGGGYEGFVVGDRLRGQQVLKTGDAMAETTISGDSFDQELVGATEYGTAFSSMTGFWVGNKAGTTNTSGFNLNADTTSNNHVALAFKRAPGFFDEVCYTGTGVARTVNHNLGAVPELILVKSRGGATSWMVYAGQADAYLSLSSSAAAQTSNTDRWNNTQPTSSVFSLGTNTTVNGSATEYVAYLFASLSGISKVGSYTGNGSNQTINCGFSAGARFVLIKRTDNTGDWYVWDTTRGIVAGNDPHLSLNSTAAEVTTNDSIDTDSTGFVVNQLAATNINVNSATYIYLAIA